MLFKSLVFSVTLFLNTHALAAKPTLPGMRYLTDDIVWMDPGSLKVRTPAIFDSRFTDDDCRDRISKVVCLVDDNSTGLAYGRECLADSAKYVPVFETLYDEFPPLLQKMFCSVSKIFIEKNLDSTAYAVPNTYAIGIRQSLLDEKLSLGAWATWKEQLPFGGSLTSYAVKEDLPSFTVESQEVKNDFLWDVVAHEFGHLFDFANQLNSGFSNVKEGSWGALSWTSFSTPKQGNDYFHRADICFYNCTGALSRDLIPQIYDELFTKTNFLNTYTGRNPYEDWADTFGFYLLFKYHKTRVVLTTNQGKTYDLSKELASARLKEKVEFVENFLNRSDILYP